MANSTGSNPQLAKYMLGDKILDNIIEQYNVDYDRHLRMLQNLAAGDVSRKPILYIRNVPFLTPTAGTSSGVSAAFVERYRQIDKELQNLTDFSNDSDYAVEAGAISTAKAIVRQLASRELAPPEIARLNHEAIVMLWALGDTRYAVTVTDGEVGYVVRRARKTIKKKSGIRPVDFDLVRIS